ALARGLYRLVAARLASAGQLRRQPALLPRHGQLVRLAGLAARRLGALVAAPAAARAAHFRPARRLRADAARDQLVGTATGRQPDRAPRAARAARRAGRAG